MVNKQSAGFYILLVSNMILLAVIIFLILELKKIDNQPEQSVEEPQSQTDETTKTASPEIKRDASIQTPIIPVTESSEFISNELRLSFKYPKTLTSPTVELIADPTRPDTASITLFDTASKAQWGDCVEEKNCIEGGPDHISIRLYKNPEGLSVKDWIIENVNAEYIYTNYDATTTELKAVRIGESNGFTYSWYGLGGADVAVFANKDNSLIYMINASFMGDTSSIRDEVIYITNSFTLLN